jgi:hypothetical protein
MSGFSVRRLAIINVFGVAAVVAGCGGGGDEAPSAAPAAPAPVALTPQLNRAQLKPVAAGIHSDVLRAANIASSAVGSYKGLGQFLSLGSGTFQCSLSVPGTLSLSVTDQATVAFLGAGDAVAMNFQSCNLRDVGQDAVLDGQQTMRVIASTGVPATSGAWDAEMSTTWNGLRSSAGSNLIASKLDGTVTFAMSGTASGTTTVTSNTPSLVQTEVLTSAIAGVASGTALSSFTFVDFTTIHSTGATGSSASVQGKTVYQKLGSPGVSPITSTYSTSVPFQTNASGQAIAGTVTVQASAWRGVTINGQALANISLPARTTFRWVVLDTTSVRLHTDENSDGVDESVHVFTFAELAQ